MSNNIVTWLVTGNNLFSVQAAGAFAQFQSYWVVECDGVSTDISLDFSTPCKVIPSHQQTPSGVFQVQWDGTVVSSGVSLSGTVVTVAFGTAPYAGQHTITVWLNFPSV